MEERLKRLARRVRLARGLRGLAIGLVVGAVVALGLALLDRFGGYYSDWSVILGACVAGSVVGFVVGYALKVGRLDLADSLDRRLGFKNRLRTALESNGDNDFEQAVLADALARLEGANGRTAFPLRLSKWHGLGLLSAGLAAFVFLMGNSPIFLSEEAKKERSDLQAAAKQIQRVARPLIEENNKDVSLEQRELAERLEKLAKDLEKGRMTKQEALVEANELAKKADELAKERFAKSGKLTVEAQSALDKMKMQKLAAGNLDQSDLENAQRKMQELQSKEDALQSEMEKLRKEMSSDSLSDSQRASLEKEFKEAQEALQDIKLSKEVLEFLDRLHSMPEFKELMEMANKIKQSAEAGEKGQNKLTQEQIDEMMKRLEELAEKLKDEEAMREFIEQLKKSLGECKGACASMSVMPAPLAILGGNGGRSQDHYFQGLDRVPKNDQEKDIAAKTEAHAVRGERSEQGSETHIEVTGPSAPGERSKTPYTKVISKYRKSAESAITRQQIPKSQQKRVREYFESLSGGK